MQNRSTGNGTGGDGGQRTVLMHRRRSDFWRCKEIAAQRLVIYLLELQIRQPVLLQHDGEVGVIQNLAIARLGRARGEADQIDDFLFG